jgi:hypothetical protein
MFKLVHSYKNHGFKRGRVLKFLAALMGTFLATGSILYISAYYITTQNAFSDDVQGLYSFWEYILRSITSSINLFAFNFDSNILDDIRDCPTLKGLIAAQTILSSLCTVAVIISLIFARAKAYYDLHYLTKVTANHNHLYLFFGINEPSILLAQDIRKNDKDKAVIIFVEQVRANEDDDGGLSNIFSVFTHQEKTFRVSKWIKAKVSLAECKPHDVELNRLRSDGNGKYDMLLELNLPKIKELISLLNQFDDSQLHIFLLSADEDENIRDLVALANDVTISQMSGTSVLHRLYCHARRNGINRVIEDIAIQNRRLDVRIVDSSHIAVELIKQQESCLPVQLVDLSAKNPTTVTSEFRSLIIGFDEVGQDAFRFLYEFAAFVDSGSSENWVIRSPFKCVAIDKSMNSIRGAFEAFTPVVRNNPYIKLVEADCNSKLFFESYCNQTLNYVVIATGNEEESMNLAVRILSYLRIHDHDVSKLRIMVRCYTKEKIEVLQKIADHYNNGITDINGAPIINMFGKPDEIYSYRMIVDDVLVKQAKQFNSSYSQLAGEAPWDERREKALNNATLDRLQNLRRKEAQDLANAVHASTKLFLLKKALTPKLGWKEFLFRYFIGDTPDREGSKSEIHYRGLDDDENQVIKNLAILEHVRWQASHEMLGYRCAKHGMETNDQLRVHNCMINWGELDKESARNNSDYKAYDYLTVDNSILLHKDELINLT